MHVDAACPKCSAPIPVECIPLPIAGVTVNEGTCSCGERVWVVIQWDAPRPQYACRLYNQPSRN